MIRRLIKLAASKSEEDLYELLIAAIAWGIRDEILLDICSRLMDMPQHEAIANEQNTSANDGLPTKGEGAGTHSPG